MNIGTWRRSLMARSSMPLPRIGSELAVDVMMMSKWASRSGSSFNVIASAWTREASCAPRSRVRLATVMDFGRRAARCVAQRSIMSRAPISSTRRSAMVGKIRSASLIEAAAIEIDALPMSVWVRTSFATAKVRWKSRLSTSPSDPAASALFTACFI